MKDIIQMGNSPDGQGESNTSELLQEMMKSLPEGQDTEAIPSDLDLKGLEDFFKLISNTTDKDTPPDTPDTSEIDENDPKIQEVAKMFADLMKSMKNEETSTPSPPQPPANDPIPDDPTIELLLEEYSETVVKQEEGINGKKFQCGMCGKKSKTKQTQQLHL